MLQEHSPAHRADTPPSSTETAVNTLVTSLAVGVTVGLAVLAAFIGAFLVRDDTTGRASPVTGSEAGATVSPGPRVPVAPVDPAAPATPSAEPAETTPPGSVFRPGDPVLGVQLWAKRPLGDIHQDQGSSIALPDGKSLWIFADTFQLYNEPKFFITSSAGVTKPDSWQLHYARTDGKPTEFLPRTPAERADRLDGDHYQAVWPTGSTLLPDGRIIISYAKYKVLVKEKDFQFLGGGLFEYRYRSQAALTDGGHATRIASDLWTPDDGEVRSPVYADGYVYFHRCRELRCQALRTTPEQLTDRASYQWWTGSSWSSDRYQAQDMSFGSSHPGGNASVVRLPYGGYAMADTEIGVVATSGVFWVAPNPWGPWSTAAAFAFPRCPPPGCYGLNLHPAQSSIDRLRVSYATNGEGPFVRVADVPVWIGPDSSSIAVRPAQP